MQMNYNIEIVSGQDVPFGNSTFVGVINSCLSMCASTSYKSMKIEQQTGDEYKYISKTRDNRTWNQTIIFDNNNNNNNSIINSNPSDNFTISEIKSLDHMRNILVELVPLYDITKFLMTMTWA